MKTAARQAFTLVELLMVMLILAVTTAVTVPYFVHSLRGNRLRTAMSSVVQAGRYARSMALLRQQEIVVRFDLDQGRIEVAPRYAQPVTNLTAEAAPDIPGDAPEPNADTGTNTPPPAVDKVSLVRVLDEVRIVEVDVEGETGTRKEGSARVIYRTNGRCTPYRVRLQDQQERTMEAEVDALSSARVQGRD